MSSFTELCLARIRLFFREPGAVFWTYGFPLVLTVVLGVAFRNRPPEPARIAIVGDGLSINDPGLRVQHLSEPDARNALRTARVDLVVLDGAPVTYWFDPTRPESRLARALTDAALHPHGPPATVDQTVTEPGSRYIDFLIPGLIGLNLMTGAMWGIGYVVAETRTKKLLKRMVATPMPRAQFLLSFIALRILFTFIELPILLGFARLCFGVHVAGSLPLFAGVAVLGALAFAGLGILLASRAQNMYTVNGLINLAQMPMFVASGVFFSVSKFPEFLQPWLRILPLTDLNDALRAVLIDGAGPRAVAVPCLYLAAIAVITFGIALRIFRWR